MTLQLDGTLLVVGAGKMGAALLDGFLRGGLSSEQVVVQDPSPSADIKARLGTQGVVVTDDAASHLKKQPEYLLLAIKPQMLSAVTPGLRDLISSDTVIMSVLAGKTIGDLNAAFDPNQPIIRAMPNTPASIGAGMTVCFANSTTTDSHRTVAATLFACAGDVAWIDDETLMDAVTAVSGSGPAYVFLLAECMADAGVSAGLDPELAGRLARATVFGAGRLMMESSQTPAELRQAVTSPGGTTEAALNVLMDDDALKTLMSRAVAAAKKRGGDLSG